MITFPCRLISNQNGRKRLKRLFTSVAAGLSSDEAGRLAETASSALKDDDDEQVSLATLLAHSGMEKIHNAPMSPPLHLSTTHTRPADGVYLAEDSKYTRMDNETRLLLEKAIFQVECSGLDHTSTECSSFAFSSGMMAVTSLLLAHTGPITVIIPDDIYHGVPTVLHNVFQRHDVQIHRVDMGKQSEILSAINKKSNDEDIIVWIETPSNPLCKVFDIQRICETIDTIREKRNNNITTVVDVTMASPVVTRPFELGADVSMHSATKYLGGHSDAVLGVLSTSPKTNRGIELAPILRSVQIDCGGIASPFDSWLTLRGMRTLQVRVAHQCNSAKAIAEFLHKHSLVSSVHYPGLESHPNHDEAKRQMHNGFGGVLSFEMEDEIVATAVAGALKVIQRATSLGGTESLIEHRASIEPPGRVTSPQGLLRLSVGLEDPRDIINDLDKAISIAHQVVSNHNNNE